MTQQVEASGLAGAPGEPPERVGSELLWRLAARLYHDHEHRPGATACAICHQPWPCSGRRLAELGLTRAAEGQADRGSRPIREPMPVHED